MRFLADWLYLIDYSRLLAAGVLRAPDLAAITAFAERLRGIMVTEMDLHRSYVAGFGITEADLEAETTAPTTQGYTDFLLRTAATGDCAELLGALLPCLWGYNEVGLRLACPTTSRQVSRRRAGCRHVPHGAGNYPMVIPRTGHDHGVVAGVPCGWVGRSARRVRVRSAANNEEARDGKRGDHHRGHGRSDRTIPPRRGGVLGPY